MKTLKTIHVGVSHRGSAHLKLYTAAKEWEPVALVDVVDEALAGARATTRLGEDRCFGSVKEAAAAVDADAAVIATPPTLHAAQVREALDAGLHVLVEKPFTLDLETATSLVAEAERRDLRLAVCQNDRYNPFNVALQEAVQSGRYGKLGFCVVNHFKARGTPYHTTPHMHLISQGVHQLDTLMAVVGKDVESVFGTSINPPWCDWPSESTVFAQITFSGGIVGQYTGTSNARSGRSSLTFRAEFERGALIYNTAAGALVLDSPNGTEEISVEKQDSTGEVARLFHRYITDGDEPPFSGRLNLNLLRVVEAIIAAGSSGKRIDFTSTPGRDSIGA